jgi:adenine deaminase
MAIGLLKGFGIKSGAVGSSISHDSHNIVAVGANDRDLSEVINHIISMQGGLAAAADGKVVSSLPLRIAGIVSEDTTYAVSSRLNELNNTVRELGCNLSDPYMTLSFLTLATVPKLKITDKGLIDTEHGQRVPLFYS